MNTRSRRSAALVTIAAFTYVATWPPDTAAAGTAHDSIPIVQASAADHDMPQREREFISIILGARNQYESGKTANTIKSARLDMQIRVVRFMAESQFAVKWVGTVQSRNVSPDGDASITVEIAPGITISTAPNRTDDPGFITLIGRESRLHAKVADASIGSPVVFSAKIIRFLITSDENMLEQPHLLAKFTSFDE